MFPYGQQISQGSQQTYNFVWLFRKLEIAMNRLRTWASHSIIKKFCSSLKLRLKFIFFSCLCLFGGFIFIIFLLILLETCFPVLLNENEMCVNSWFLARLSAGCEICLCFDVEPSEIILGHHITDIYTEKYNYNDYGSWLHYFFPSHSFSFGFSDYFASFKQQF